MTENTVPYTQHLYSKNYDGCKTSSYIVLEEVLNTFRFLGHHVKMKASSAVG